MTCDLSLKFWGALMERFRIWRRMGKLKLVTFSILNLEGEQGLGKSGRNLALIPIQIFLMTWSVCEPWFSATKLYGKQQHNINNSSSNKKHMKERTKEGWEMGILASVTHH